MVVNPFSFSSFSAFGTTAGYPLSLSLLAAAVATATTTTTTTLARFLAFARFVASSLSSSNFFQGTGFFGV